MLGRWLFASGSESATSVGDAILPEGSGGWQRTCTYRSVRIASKSATTTDTAAPVSALSGKSSGGSFLDILLSGTGVGIQLPQTARGVTAKSESDAGDQTGAEDGNAQGSLQTDAESGTAAPVNANLNAAVQAANAQNGQAQNASTSAETSQALLGAASFDAAQWLVKSASAIASTEVAGRASGSAEPTTGSTKTSGSTQERRVKSAAAAASGDVAATSMLVAPAPLALEAAMRTAQDSSAMLSSALAGIKPAGTGQDAQDSTPALSNEAPSAADQAASHLAQAFAADLADATQGAQSDSPSQGSAAAQVATLQSAVAANASASGSLLSAQALPKGADLSQASQTKSVGSAFALGSNASSQAGNASGTAPAAKNGSQSSDNAGSSNGQGSGSTPAGGQAAASQIQGAAVRPIETGALQTIPFAVPSTTHEAVSSHGSTSGTAEGKAAATSENLPSDALNPAGAAGSPGINSARLIQSMSESEMRVGMRSTEFGDISIRTMVTQQQVQAQISVDHSELSNVLSSHIPAIQAKFGNELGLQATVEVNQSGMSFSGERGQSSPQQQPQSFVRSISTEGAGTIVDNDPLPLRAPLTVVGGSRLDIQA
jgi:trimeric autotransporter adhesin